ncbi:MAG: FAD-dependent monooxygenase [Proteobacteria bacterium]|nr:FAD-dependent monooxygenase [Pseudomonadota bacterium]
MKYFFKKAGFWKTIVFLSLVSHHITAFEGEEEWQEREGFQSMRVLISGYGIAGKTMANVFFRAGICPDIIERDQKESLKEGTGIALPANAVWALRKLGFEKELNERAMRINNMSFSKPDGEILTTRSVSDIHPEGIPFMALHRKSLSEMLEFPISHLPVSYKTTVTKLEEKEREVVVTFNTGITKTYDLVIGADGIHSQIRSLLYPQALHPIYQGIFTWRTVVDLEEGPQNPVYMMGANTFFLIYPIGKEGEYYIYAHQMREKRERETPEKEAATFLEIFRTYGGDVPRILKKIHPQDIVTGFIENVSEVLWGEGRVVLMGDAAHACAPGLQQGGAQTIEDGFVWSEEFQRAGMSLDDIIRNFKARRQMRVQKVVEASNMRMKLMSQEDMETRYHAIRENGPLNRPGFITIMQSNP